MSQEHKCELCEVTRRVFGDRFKGCADIGNVLAISAVKYLKREITNLMSEVIEENARGRINKEDFEKMKFSLEHMFTFASALIPAVAITEGANTNPAEMKKFVEVNLFALVQRAIEKQMEEQGPEGVVASLINALKDVAGEESAEEPSEESIKKDPNIN